MSVDEAGRSRGLLACAVEGLLGKEVRWRMKLDTVGIQVMSSPREFPPLIILSFPYFSCYFVPCHILNSAFVDVMKFVSW